MLSDTDHYNQAQKFKQDPEIFFENILGVETLEDYQRRVLQTIKQNERTAIAACHDVGKSFLMARIAMWFLNTHPNSKVITTAPTFNQVERILWSEIRAAHLKAKWPLGGRLNQTDWTFSPDWFALGFSPRNEATSGEGQGTQSSFQGFHAAHLMVIFDEATGIDANIWTMAEGLLTSANVKFVAIGNPTSQASEFYRCFKDPRWAKVYLSCFDSPNLKANGLNSIDDIRTELEILADMTDVQARAHVENYKIKVPYLLTAKWVVESARKWGLTHPLTVSKIFGKFPAAGDNTLMPLGFVEEAQLRVVYPLPTDRKSIGVDVARFGTDSTVLTSMHGFKQLGRREFFKRDTIEVVGEVIAMVREIQADIVVVDETGIGGGVVDLLRDALNDGTLPKGLEIRGVQFGAACEMDSDKEKFVNLKARMFSLLSDALKKDQHLLNDSVYLEELPTIQYKYDKKGRMYIESKDEYKKRTGRKSPDSADSLALAHYGMHDEMTVGKFSKEYFKDIPFAPRSGGLNQRKAW